MGEGSLGTLLELGSEGDMGPGDMALLCALYTFKTYGKDVKDFALSASHLFLHLPADVLVGCELPPVSPGQYTCLQ